MSKYQAASDRTKVNVNRLYMDEWVRVKKSNFLSSMGIAGRGLYAMKPYARGDVILEYKGKILTDQQAEEKKGTKKYLFDVKDKGKVIFVIDGANNVFASPAKFVNTVRVWSDPQRNSEFKQYRKKIYLVASKPIKTGEEFITYYGPETDKVIEAD